MLKSRGCFLSTIFPAVPSRAMASALTERSPAFIPTWDINCSCSWVMHWFKDGKNTILIPFYYKNSKQIKVLTSMVTVFSLSARTISAPINASGWRNCPPISRRVKREPQIVARLPPPPQPSTGRAERRFCNASRDRPCTAFSLSEIGNSYCSSSIHIPTHQLHYSVCILAAIWTDLCAIQFPPSIVLQAW